MGQAINKIKTRIRSVTGAYKVTSAMKLVSTVRLKSWKNKMLSNRDYFDVLESISKDVFKYAEHINSPLLNKNNSNKKLYIVVTSSLGLCGSYNTNIFKLVDNLLGENDELIVLGKKGISHFTSDKYKLVNGFDAYSSIADELIIKKLTATIIKKYSEGEYDEIHLIYSHYRNSLTFIPKDMQLLPLKRHNLDNNEVGYGPRLEPNPQMLFEQLLDLYMKNVVYTKLLESEVCEQAARSNAMENATDNASELLNELQIEYNKARQSAITQEIVEIVGAAEAL